MLKYLSITALLVFTSCSTRVPISIQKAPEIYIHGVKTVSVNSFNMQGNLDLNTGVSGGGILGAITDVALSAGTNALLITESQNASFSSYHKAGLEQDLSKNGFYTVTKSDVSQANLNGTVNYEVIDVVSESQSKDDKGNSYTVYKITRSASADILLNIFNAAGKMIASTQTKAIVSDSKSNSSLSSAKNKLSSWKSLINKAIKKSWPQTTRKIAPYYVTEYRTFAEGESDEIEDANELAKKGNWIEAEKVWNGFLTSENKENKGAALYNKAIKAEVDGDLNKSQEFYTKAFEVSAIKNWQKDISRIETQIQETAAIKAAAHAQSIAPIKSKQDLSTTQVKKETSAVQKEKESPAAQIEEKQSVKKIKSQGGFSPVNTESSTSVN
jgi:hypothetical protein